jgi:hypothetical protein
MREYTVNGIMHPVYDDLTEVPETIKPKKNWRRGDVNDWVKTDDGAVIQILRKDLLGRKKLLGTCTGTFEVSDDNRMHTDRQSDIYSLSGQTWYERLVNREKATIKEKIFARRIGASILRGKLGQQGEDPVDVYLSVFNTENRNYAKRMSALLIKTGRIQALIDDELKDVFDRNEINLDYLISSAKDVVDTGKNNSDRINALKMLWDAFGVVKKQQVTQVTGLFQGFSPDQLGTVTRPQLEQGDK